MIILGINDTHDASACLVVDGKIINVIQEERLRRKKGISSLPSSAIKFLLKSNNLKKNQIDYVCFANNRILNMALWNIHGDFKTSDWFKLQEDYYFERIYNKKNFTLKKIFPHYKPSIKLGYNHKNIPFISTDEATYENYQKIRRMRVTSISKLLNIEESKISFHDHHECHAFYGFYTNPKKNEKVAVITADGGGDGVYNTVSYFKKGVYKNLIRSNKNWIGKIYSSTTLILGLNPFRHLYKVMGLAPYAHNKNYKEILKFYLSTLKVKNLDFEVNKLAKDNYYYFKKNLNRFRFDNIAGALQEFVELRLVEWFKNISNKLKINNFVFSGGVANNVKANKILADQKFIKSMWIPPGPGDESLCVGAVYNFIYKKLGPSQTMRYIKTPKNAYWGPRIQTENLKKFKKNQLIKKYFDLSIDKSFLKSANLLSKGEILFVLFDKQEFGQRALGHRSIVCDPSNIPLVKKINSTIKMRDFWMPFTPSILEDYKYRYFDYKKNINYEYMTVCADTNELGKRHLSAAIHSADNTIRPQIVKKTTCKNYYSLIKAFSKKKGIGSLLNTSLNMHEFPIITQPTDLIKEIIKKNNSINFSILIENHLFTRKDFK